MSLPGLTRQSIFFGKKLMDARIKSGHDSGVLGNN
jgi:hypothetical protein